MMEAYSKNTYKYSWRDTDSTRDGIRKSLGLPLLPSRRWSTKTYSEISDETSDGISEFINDDSEDEEEAQEDNIEPEKPDSGSIMFDVIQSVCILVIATLLGGPIAALLVFAILLIANLIINLSDATKEHLEAKRQDDDHDIHVLVRNLRDTTFVRGSYEGERLYDDVRANIAAIFNMMLDSYGLLRSKVEAGSLAKGSKEYREFRKLESILLGYTHPK